jgi:NADPH:quinone reductase-like Zn-dependent oxidoreductase
MSGGRAAAQGARAAAPARAPAPPPPPPATFRRLVARGVGRSFRAVAEVEEVLTPALAEGEVLVRVAYAGVNGGCETFRARGEHAFARNRSAVRFALGAEGAGVVAAAGPGVPSALGPGAAVTFVGGAFAEYVVAKAAAVWPVPAPTAAAAALAISGTVAAAALFEVGRLRAGEALLVTAAGGATGCLAAQLGLNAGCRVVATCGGEAKAARLRALGRGIRVIDHRAEDACAILRHEYADAVDVAYEGVGGALRAAALAALAPGGRMLAVGYISEYPHVGSYPELEEPGAVSGAAERAPGSSGTTSSAGGERAARLPPAAELFWGGRRVDLPGGRVVHGQVWPAERAATLRAKAALFAAAAAGELAPWVDGGRAFRGLAAVPDAVDYMLGGAAVGKVVVALP